MLRLEKSCRHFRDSGSILLTVIVAMVMISLFSITFLTLTDSSLFSNVATNFGVRAQYLAESGFRYAASEYLHSGDMQAKLVRLEELDRTDVALADNHGGFSLSVIPFWFIALQEYDIGEENVSLRVKVPGHFDDKYTLPSSGTVKVVTSDGNDQGWKFYSYSNAAKLDGQNATFRLLEPLEYPITSKSNVFLVFNTTESTTVTSGGDLKIDAAMLGALPRRNGQIEINDSIYYYKEIQENPLRLKELTKENGGAFSMTVDTTTPIILKRQILLKSTGHIGGDSSFSATRGIEYNVPISDEIFEPSGNATTLALSDQSGGQELFENLDNWHDPGEQVDTVLDLIASGEVNKNGLYSDLGSGAHGQTEYVVFHDLAVTDPPGGYTLRAVDKGLLPAECRDTDFYGIWGDAADDLYVVGEHGTILHFNGRTWSRQGSEVTSKTLRAVWGVDQTHVVAVGNDGEVLVKDGTSWDRMLMGEPYDDWWSGWTFNPDEETVPLSAFDLYGVWGTAWDHITTYGDRGGSPYRWDGRKPWYRYWDRGYRSLGNTSGLHWRAYDRSAWSNLNFRCNWEYDTGRYQHLFSVGQLESVHQKGFVFREKPDRDSYYIESYSLHHDFPALYGIWGSSLNDIYAVGDNGSIFHNTSNGDKKGWDKIYHSLTTKRLNSVYGISENFVYAVGDSGIILHKNESGWSKIENSVSSSNLNGVWGNGDVNGLYAVGNDGTILYLGSEENPIKKEFLLLNKESAIRDEWNNAAKYLGYTIQTKIGWGDKLKYTASGICFRWHHVGGGNYEGYGVSFMKYAPRDHGNDFIPDSMKPGFKFMEDKSDKILVVLWKQYVQNGIEKREWVAYKDITSDFYMYSESSKGLKDLSSLVVRIQEKNIDGMRINDINIYYSDAYKNNFFEGDEIYNNILRKPYYPTFTSRPHRGIIRWPIWDLDKWKYSDDYFTVVDKVSVEASPVESTDSWIVNPFVRHAWLMADGHTIRTNDFLSPYSIYDDPLSDRPEIGLCVFGEVGTLQPGQEAFVVFGDFAVQLGANSDGRNQQSSFGRLQ